MNDHNEQRAGGIGERSRQLAEAIAAAGGEADVTLGLPDEVEPGRMSFTYMVDVWGQGELQAQDITFEWDGGRSATWVEDISGHEAISPGSSAPTTGWASWQNGTDLLLAYANADAEFEGWARIAGAAPTAGTDDEDEDVLSAPQRWLALARMISAVVGEQELEGMTGERFGE